MEPTPPDDTVRLIATALSLTLPVVVFLATMEMWLPAQPGIQYARSRITQPVLTIQIIAKAI